MLRKYINMPYPNIKIIANQNNDPEVSIQTINKIMAIISTPDKIIVEYHAQIFPLNPELITKVTRRIINSDTTNIML